MTKGFCIASLKERGYKYNMLADRTCIIGSLPVVIIIWQKKSLRHYFFFCELNKNDNEMLSSLKMLKNIDL